MVGKIENVKFFIVKIIDLSLELGNSYPRFNPLVGNNKYYTFHTSVILDDILMEEMELHVDLIW